MGCQQVEIDLHRWYVVIRITLENGTDIFRVYAPILGDGIQEFDSIEEYEKEVG